MVAARRASALPLRHRQPVGRLTEAGLWALSHGDAPHVVTLRENREPGAPLVWDYAGHRARSVGERIVVRRPDGRGGWEWDLEAVARAERKAHERHHERALRLSPTDAFAAGVRAAVEDFGAWLRPHLLEPRAGEVRQQLDRLAQRIAALPRPKAPGELTIEEGFALYHDPEKGGLPKSRSARTHHAIARNVWSAALRDASGNSMPWNSVTPADIEAVATRFKESGKVNSGDRAVRCLTAVHNWLRKKRRMRQLENPAEGFDTKAYWEGYEVTRERYSKEELRKLIAVRDQVDPRYALLVVLIRFRGDRKGAYLDTMRSAFMGRLAKEPSKADAPHGWLKLPAMKGGRPPLIFLTARQRAEIDKALAGPLRELEARYQATGKDYPLFPRVRLRGPALARPFNPDAAGAYEPLGAEGMDKLLREAEKQAGVVHRRWRGWHAFRRVASHAIAERVGKEATSDALGWVGTEMLDTTYMEDERHVAAAKTREAMEDEE
jgi:hypothetical protein